MPEATPSWINLDEICPPELREEAARVTAKLTEAVTDLGDIVDDALAVMADMDALLPEVVGSASGYEVFGSYTGQERLRSALCSITELGERADRS